VNRPTIDPALGLDLVPTRTLVREEARVSVVIPAHNEAETIEEVVSDCQRGLGLLNVDGEVIVSASACTDATASLASSAGARVVECPLGKGAAVREGLAVASGEILCLVDGDLRYFGDHPLVTILVEPILRDIADATIADLYWRPLYPQMWLHAFFTPAASVMFPEILAKVGSSPWSGQRAARRELWPDTLPDDFTVDIAILLHWHQHAVRLRAVLTDDWINPQRPKPDLMAQELEVMINHAQQDGRVTPTMATALRTWYDVAHGLMATYRHGVDDPQDFERRLVATSLGALRAQLVHAGLADLSTHAPAADTAS
jgi:glucosyl-3-phosphoglycerate synthase